MTKKNPYYYGTWIVSVIAGLLSVVAVLFVIGLGYDIERIVTEHNNDMLNVNTHIHQLLDMIHVNEVNIEGANNYTDRVYGILVDKEIVTLEDHDCYRPIKGFGDCIIHCDVTLSNDKLNQCITWCASSIKNDIEECSSW